MQEGRNKQMIIDAIEWAINVSEQIACDLIRGMGITSDELNFIGYDKNDFPALHKYTE